MLESALKILKEINSYSYEAYIVGGFVRDYLLGIESRDIDIATNATPKAIKSIFKGCILPNDDYGSVIVIRGGIRFEITTFRREISYVDNRKPSEIKYIDSIEEDLLRRDFTINSICMDQDGKIIDLLNGIHDLQDRKIISIGDPKIRFEEDALRILRAIRFATVLDFELDESIVLAIKCKKHLLKNLSYYRKKQELSKIFSSSNCKKGMKLLLKFGLDEILEIPNLSKALNVSDLIGIWSILNVVDIYPFSSTEKSLITNVNKALECDNLDPMSLYKYGLYVNSVAGDIKGIKRKSITSVYNSLAIHKRGDIDITGDEIARVLDKEPGEYLNDIFKDLEHAILYDGLENDKSRLVKYVIHNYKK